MSDTGCAVSREDVLGEACDATIADTHGRRGEAIDVWAVQEGGLERGFGDEVWGCAIALSEQADCSDGRLLGAFALAAALEGGDHGLAQWGHARSPFVRCRIVRLRRKTS